MPPRTKAQDDHSRRDNVTTQVAHTHTHDQNTQDQSDAVNLMKVAFEV